MCRAIASRASSGLMGAQGANDFVMSDPARDALRANGVKPLHVTKHQRYLTCEARIRRKFRQLEVESAVGG